MSIDDPNTKRVQEAAAGEAAAVEAVEAAVPADGNGTEAPDPATDAARAETPPPPAPVTGDEPPAPATGEEPFTAAAPPHPSAAGTGETNFADAAVPPTGDAPLPPAGEANGEDPSRADADRYLALAQRTQADFDNFRKRAQRDAAVAGERGVSKVVKELLPALDHLELALQAAEKDPAAAEITKGFRLIQGELVKALGRVGVDQYSPRGERFDPEQHEAMAQVPTEGAEAGSVVEVYQQGYRLNGMVLRPARVVVAG